MKLTRALFHLTAAILAIFSAASFLRSFMGSDLRIYILYSVLMAGDAACMFICGFFLARKSRPLFWFAVIVLSLNIVLTVFDQFRLADLLFVLLNIGTLASLIIQRKELLLQ